MGFQMFNVPSAKLPKCSARLICISKISGFFTRLKPLTRVSKKTDTFWNANQPQMYIAVI